MTPPFDPAPEKLRTPAADEVRRFLDAIRTGHPGHFQLFLNRYRNLAISVADASTGETALMTAAAWNRLDILEDLLHRGAGINGRDKQGNTALMMAARYNRFDAVTKLIDRGADLDARNNHGLTALVFSTYDNGVESARELLAHGANSEHLSAHHWTPMIRALVNGHKAVAILPPDHKHGPKGREADLDFAQKFARWKAQSALHGVANDESAEEAAAHDGHDHAQKKA